MTDRAIPGGAPRLRDARAILSIDFLKKLSAGVGAHHLPTFAAGLAYGAVFAILPMLALLVTLLGLFHAVDLVERAIEELQPVLPADVMDLVSTQLRAVAESSSDNAIGKGALISVAVALWGASGAMRRVMEALNVVHHIEETRPYVRKMLVSFVLAIGAIIFVAVSLVVVVVGGGVADRSFDVIGLGDGAAELWSSVRWLVLLALTWLAIAAAYRFAPAVRQRGGIATPGTFIATIGWLGFSAAFSWYVGRLGNFDAAWGAVAGIIVLLLYVQYAGLIILVGALIDVLLYDADRPASRVRRALHIPASKT